MTAPATPAGPDQVSISAGIKVVVAYPLHETTHGGMTGASAQWGRGKQGDLATSRDRVESEPARG
jgi:hypothetical protein